MRRKDKQVTDRTALHEVIRQAEVCRIGFVDGDTPYVLPLSFGFDGVALFFHSAPEGRKVDVLERNNRVCVEFDAVDGIAKTGAPCNWTARYRSVLWFGRATLLTDEAEKRHALNQIIAHYDPSAAPREFAGADLSRLNVYRIDLDELDGKSS
ncbi:MAG: pyridoxamine 5'-phosphate oxidase family protein [Chitinophagales bacterium]